MWFQIFFKSFLAYFLFFYLYLLIILLISTYSSTYFYCLFLYLYFYVILLIFAYLYLFFNLFLLTFFLKHILCNFMYFFHVINDHQAVFKIFLQFFMYFLCDFLILIVSQLSAWFQALILILPILSTSWNSCDFLDFDRQPTFSMISSTYHNSTYSFNLLQSLISKHV